MGGVSVESNNKLDTELNLVPFIDLLSTLTLFLLLTAVWVQISVIPASVDSKGRATSSNIDDTKLQIHVTNSGMNLTWPGFIRSKAGGGLPSHVAKTSTGYDSVRFSEVLEKAAKNYKLMVAAVSADDGVEYGAVIEAVDLAKTAGVPTVALSTTK